MRALLPLSLLLACNDPKGSEISDTAPEEVTLCSPEKDWGEVQTVNTETAGATASVITPVPTDWIVEKAEKQDLEETEAAITRITSEEVYHNPANPPEGVAYMNINTYEDDGQPWESSLYAAGSTDPETIAKSVYDASQLDNWNVTEVSPVECLALPGVQLCGLITAFSGTADDGSENGSPYTTLLVFGLTESAQSSIKIALTTGENISGVSSWNGWTAALSQLSEGHVFKQGACSVYSTKVE